MNLIKTEARKHFYSQRKQIENPTKPKAKAQTINP